MDGGPLTVQYLLVVDALNFCFWPEEGLEYEHLAGGVKRSLLEDQNSLSAERLSVIDGAGVQRLLGWPRPVPLQDERARLLREVGRERNLLRDDGDKVAVARLKVVRHYVFSLNAHQLDCTNAWY